MVAVTVVGLCTRSRRLTRSVEVGPGVWRLLGSEQRLLWLHCSAHVQGEGRLVIEGSEWVVGIGITM